MTISDHHHHSRAAQLGGAQPEHAALLARGPDGRAFLIGLRKAEVYQQIAQAVAAGRLGEAELWRAVAAGAATISLTDNPAAPHTMGSTSMPTVLLIDDRVGLGPDGWRATASVIANTAHGFVTTCDDSLICKAVLLAAWKFGPAGLVETTPQHAEAWAAAFQAAGKHVIISAPDAMGEQAITVRTADARGTVA